MSTLKASENGIKEVDRLRKLKGWNKSETAWIDLAHTSEPTLKRFWARQPVTYKTFVDICSAVGIEDWKKIVDETDCKISDKINLKAIPFNQENRCPDCLFINIEAFTNEYFSPQQIELNLTICFNEQWEDLDIGRVKFGIRSGDFRISLRNAMIPYKFRKLKTKNCYISTKGSEERPVWEFKVKESSESILKLLLDDVQLATVQTTDNSPGLEAVFEISINDLVITDIEGVFDSSTNVNKQCIIRNEIINYLQSKVKPYMSKLEMKYEQ